MRRIDLDDEEIGLNQGDRALNDKTGMAQPDVIFLDRSMLPQQFCGSALFCSVSTGDGPTPIPLF